MLAHDPEFPFRVIGERNSEMSMGMSYFVVCPFAEKECMWGTGECLFWRKQGDVFFCHMPFQ